MAGEWIKWTKGLADKREVVVLAAKLSRDRHEIASRLMVLWEWCDDNVTESDTEADSLNVSLVLGDKPFAFVDALLGLPGMAEAMASPEVRWLEARSGGRIVFPNLARHNGTSAKTRAYEQRKKQDQRERAPKSSPKVSPNSGDKTGTRGEERRVKTKDPPPPFGSEAFAAAWLEWETYRREQGKSLKPTTVRKQFKFLASLGEAAAIASLDRSVRNGWSGLFPPKDDDPARAKTGPRPEPDIDRMRRETERQLREAADRKRAKENDDDPFA